MKKMKRQIINTNTKSVGINFGNSIGDMELHKLTVHLQKGDTKLK